MHSNKKNYFLKVSHVSLFSNLFVLNQLFQAACHLHLPIYLFPKIALKLVGNLSITCLIDIDNSEKE